MFNPVPDPPGTALHVLICDWSLVVLLQMSPVVIVLVSDGKRCLLGRQSSFPRGMYSALAGFCDMGQCALPVTTSPAPHTCLTSLAVSGESLEDTVCREVAEEVGLEVHSVSYSSSQHWPFPHSSFMMGCHASVSPAHSQVSTGTSQRDSTC